MLEHSGKLLKTDSINVRDILGLNIKRSDNKTDFAYKKSMGML